MRRIVPANLRRIALTSASALLSACSSMRVHTAPIPEPLPKSNDNVIRLSMRNGNVVYLFDAKVVGDSVIGFDRRSTLESAQRVAVAKADIDAVAVKRGDAFKTVLAVVGGTLAALTFISLVACASLLSGTA